MKRIYKVILLFVISFYQLNAQNVELLDIKAPFAPGERLLSFNVDDQLQSQYYVFYSNNRNELANIALNNNGNNVPYGKAIKYNGTTNRESKIEFVFPGSSTPKGPNAYYYITQERRQGISFKGSSYLTNKDRLIAAKAPNVVNKAFDSEKNERIYRKECMFFRVLEINSFANVNRMSQIQSFYMPDDFTIGFAGDSFAAGTGVDKDPDNLCYRSQKSGQMLAVKKFIRSNPNVSVSYFHSACNGARTRNLFDISQAENQNIQFTMLQDWLNQNNFDYLNLLIMNIGGNNVDFAYIVKHYYVFPGNFDGSEDQDLMPERFSNLRTSYNNLELAINEKFPFTSTAITTLPKVTRNAEGEFCCDNYLDYSEYSCAYNTHPSSALFNPPSEFQAVENDILIPLNNTIREKANDHNWDVIDVEDNANNNGLCVCENNGGYFWSFRRATANLDVNFTSHPNAEGHKSIYRDDIYYYIENKYNRLSERYPLRFLFNNAEIPNCNAFIESYTTRLQLANTIDLSNIKSTKVRNRIKQANNKLLIDVKKTNNPKTVLLKEKRKQKLLNKKRQKETKSKLKQIVNPVTKTDIKNRISKIESSKEYKNWVNAKTPKEIEDAYQKLAKKMIQEKKSQNQRSKKKVIPKKIPFQKITPKKKKTN